MVESVDDGSVTCAQLGGGVPRKQREATHGADGDPGVQTAPPAPRMQNVAKLEPSLDEVHISTPRMLMWPMSAGGGFRGTFCMRDRRPPHAAASPRGTGAPTRHRRPQRDR